MIRYTFLHYCAFCFFALIITFFSAYARPEMATRSAADRFALMDKDTNGFVSEEEFFTAQPHMRKEAFTTIDTNTDAQISLTEWEAFFEGHGKGEAGGGMGMPPQSGTPSATEGQGASPAKPQLLLMPKRTQD